MRARYFGMIFDQVPSYAEITKIPGVNELFRLTNPGIIDLVHHIDLSWNTIEPSLSLMHEKLTDLGWVTATVKYILLSLRPRRAIFMPTLRGRDQMPNGSIRGVRPSGFKVTCIVVPETFPKSINCCARIGLTSPSCVSIFSY